MKLRKPVALFFIVALLPACATITRGTKEAFSVQTIPAGANVTMSNGFTCTTPCTLRLPHRSTFIVNISKRGYQDVEANVTHTVAGGGAAGMAGNILLGGLIGAAVDAGTGSTQKLVPNPLVITLEPDSL